VWLRTTSSNFEQPSAAALHASMGLEGCDGVTIVCNCGTVGGSTR
jgi:hypothetical protein